MMTIKLINLESGETMDADPDALRDRGLPEDYVVADQVTTEEWILALQQAIQAENTLHRIYS